MTRQTLIAMTTLALLAVQAWADPTPVGDDATPPTPAPATAAPANVYESEVTVMPAAFTSFGACVQGDYLYAIGGHTSPPHHYDREGFNRAFWRLNLRDRKSWEVLPGGVPLQSVALVSDGKRILRVGGMTAVNAPGEQADLRSTTEVASFDPLKRQWTDLPALPDARSSHDALFVNGKLYVTGGWKLAGDELSRNEDDSAWHTTTLVLDPGAEKPEWQAIEQPFKRRALVLAATGSRLYAIGGMTPKGISKQVDIYDTAEGKWTKGPDMPSAAFGSGAVELNGRIFASTMDGNLYSHAPGEEAWRAEGSLTFSRFFLRLLAVGDELAAIGGTMRGGHVRNIEWIKPSHSGPVVTRVNLPAPGSAKVRQGIFFYNNTLYVFGGNNAVKDHQFAPENFVDEAFKISLAGLHAERIEKLPVKRQSFVTYLTGTDDRFAEKVGYAVGGFWHDGKAALSTPEILLYSIDADVWQTAPFTLPNALTQFGLAEHDGKIYLFGGLNFDPARGKRDQFQESGTVWRLDPKAKEAKWEALDTQLPTKRRAFGGAVLGDKYCIVGGMTKDFEEVDRCDVYDFKKNEWSTIPVPGDVRLSPKLLALNGKLYLVGGSSPTEDRGFQRNGSIEEFDPATGKWRTIVGDIQGDLGELQAFVFGRSLLLYSVHNPENEVRLIFIKP